MPEGKYPPNTSLSRVHEDRERKCKSDSSSLDIGQGQDTHISRRDGAEMSSMNRGRLHNPDEMEMETKSCSIMGGSCKDAKFCDGLKVMDSHTSFEHALQMTNAC